MSLVHTPILFMQEGFPRVSGDEPFRFDCSNQSIEFSPRERG